MPSHSLMGSAEAAAGATQDMLLVTSARRWLRKRCFFLMMQRVFDELGYRRYEWKTDSFNASSRRAAARYGFSFEGIFRQAVVYKGRNRDTAWFSILDRDWPRIRQAFVRWLDAANFDAAGRQQVSLSELMA